MKLSIISFTENGTQLSEHIKKILEQDMAKGQIPGRELPSPAACRLADSAEASLYAKHGSCQEGTLEVCPYTKYKACQTDTLEVCPYTKYKACQTDTLEACLYTKCKACQEKESPSVRFVDIPLRDWARKQMEEKNALLFIGACGIAVRAIAPSLTDKLQDSPVLVMDEKGSYIIPILSGHVGGANEIANHIAGKTGAKPVITTATDINQAFAVDIFAKKNGLSIVNKDGIVKVSSKTLTGQSITMSVEPGHAMEENCSKNTIQALTQPQRKPKEPIPGNGGKDILEFIPYPPKDPVDIVISSEERTFDTSLLLRPKEYIIGLGCKKGKSPEEIEDFIQEKTGELGITSQQIFALASISQKSQEQGILAWCQKMRIPFFTYTAEELQKVEGNFQSSAFVKEQVGVDNVCERAALMACQEGGCLISPKQAKQGMTIAIAKREWRIYFYRR